MKISVVGLKHEYDTNVQVAVPREEVFLEHAGYRGGFGFPEEPAPSQFYVVADVKYDKAQGYLYTLINKATKKISQTNMIYRESDITTTNGYELGFCKVDTEDIYMMPKDEFRLLCARANALVAMNVPYPKLKAYRELPEGYRGTRYIELGRKFTRQDLRDKISSYCKKQYPDYNISVEMDSEEYLRVIASEFISKMEITIHSGPQELRSAESVLRGYVRTRGVEPNGHYKSLLTPQGYNMLIDITQYAMSYNFRFEHEDYQHYNLDVNIGSWQDEYTVDPNFKEKRQYYDEMISFPEELKSLDGKLESIEREMEHRQFTSAIETFNECYQEGARLDGEWARLEIMIEEVQATQNNSQVKSCENQLGETVDLVLINRAEQLQTRRTLLEEGIREEMHYLSDGNATPDKELLDKWADLLNIESRMPLKSCLPTIEHIGIGRALADAANNFSQTDCLRTLTHEPYNSPAMQHARRQVLAEAIREEIRFQQADFDRQKGEFWEYPEDQYNPEIQCQWSAFKEKYNQEYKKWNEVLTEVEKQIKGSTKSKIKDGPSRLLQSIEDKINEKTATNANKTIDIQNPKTI